MPTFNRVKTKYPGVYYIDGKGVRGPEKIYYISYRKDGRKIEEKVGRQFRDDMTPSKAASIRSERIEGKQLSNKERRSAVIEAKKNEAAKWTVGRLWEEYLKHNPDSKSFLADKYRYKKHIRDSFGDKTPHEIIQLDVDRVRIKLMKVLSPQTVKHVLSLLTRISNFGHKKGLCAGLGFIVQMPRVDNIVTEDLSPDLLKRLLDAIHADPNKVVANMMLMALYTGMRRGELLKLKWDDIDFSKGFITIRSPKGGRDQTIPLNSQTHDLLVNHPRTDSPYIFPGKDGKQRVEVYNVVNRIKKRAGIPKNFRPLHGLRHTYASMLASSGQVDMYTLQKLLTHKNPIMTQRYAHLRDETLKKASNLAGELINQAMVIEESKTKR
jgi:integrase